MIYLDNAATTIKKPDAVYDAVLDAMKHYLPIRPFWVYVPFLDRSNILN